MDLKNTIKGGQASVVHHAFPQIKEKELSNFSSLIEKTSRMVSSKEIFVYVKDIVDIMTHMYTESSRVESGLYNLGTGEARSFVDLGRAVFKALNVKDEEFIWIDMPDSLKNQYQYFTEANIKKLREKAHYTKKLHSLEDGVYDYVVNYLNKEDSYLFYKKRKHSLLFFNSQAFLL